MRSSEIRALADDTSKDDDSVGFLAQLPLVEQAEWLRRLRWVRVSDRLAENELLEPARRRFTTFLEQWHALVDGGEVSGEHEALWREMRAAWWTPGGAVRAPLEIAAFSGYLGALRDYTRHELELSTLGDHDRMLMRLTGNIARVFPYLTDSQRDAAAGFGMLDQLMNNLRDVAEDAAHGLCFFPRDVLGCFGVSLSSVLDGSAIGTRGFDALMHFWLDEHLPWIRDHAAPFFALPDLHPSLVTMRRGSADRYARIERTLRRCGFDYAGFSRTYWGRGLDAQVA